jgi:16S rRNA (cytosine1407-C5)-methyltransferase
MYEIQTELINSAYKMLKPGGCLVYSTCTFSIEENENIIKEVMQHYDDIEIININNNKFPKGLSGNSKIDESVIRVMPHLIAYDGFFIACIRKKGDLKTNEINYNFKDKFNIKKYFTNNFNGNISEQKNICFYESPCELKYRFNKTGIKLGKIIKNKIDISTQFLWEFGNYIKDEYKIELNYNEALEYFKGNDITKSANSKEQFACFCNNLPIGIIKQVDNRLKNKLDRFFLYGRNY